MKSFKLILTGILLAILGSGTAAAQEPEYSREGADTCLSCHEDDSVLVLFRGAHANPNDPRSPFGHGQLQCEACHGPSGDHTKRVRRGQERPSPAITFLPGADESAEDRNSMCLGCHDGNAGFSWHGSTHDDNTVACVDCHTAHTASDPILAVATQPEACFDCHQQKRTQTMKPYAHPIRQGKMACSDCHNPHGTSSGNLLAQQTLNDTCFDCHAEKRGPYLWEHAPATEDCSTCHEPHGSSHPGMLTMRAPMLCQSCHSQAGHPSVTNDADGLPEGMPSQFLLGQNCLNCHTQSHGSNHPSGSRLMR